MNLPKSDLEYTSSVTDNRTIILDMKDDTVRCDAWDGGFNLYLPVVGIVDEDIGAAVTELKNKNLLCDIDDPDQKLQFTAFQTNPAWINTPTGETPYKPLVDICKVLQELRLWNGREASCELVQNSYSFNVAEPDGENFKVDAYLKLRRSTMPASHPPSTKIPIADVAVPSEYKTNERDFVAYHEQLLDAAAFCMNNDPRRMHIYGIIIKDSKMTVWYFSRSHSAKSPEFDFTEDPETYVRVMLSFLFATEEELGYDPTVQRRLEAKTLCFVYKVEDNTVDKAEKRDRYFKTQRAIFEDRSLCTTGRATRVWKVVEVRSFNDLQPLDGSTIMVLKDVWLDSDLETEGQKLDAIFEKLKEIARHLNEGDEGLEIFNGLGEKLENALKLCLKAGSWGQYFLTKVCDWQGCESKKAPPAASDRTRTTTLQATYPVPVAQNQLPRRYCPKRQYRIIFEEVCEALHDVEQLRDVATALLDSVFGESTLQLMFLAGWVHRDISSGNIYAYRFQESGTDKVRGILADLEFAKLFEAERAEGSSDPRTGTAFFMPVEIQRQILFYNPAASRKMPSRVKPKNKEPDNNNNKSSSSSEESSDEEASESDLKRSIGVIHNFEHDMESIFWLLLWILSVRFPPERTAQQERECQRAVSTIFQNTSQCPPEREQIFTCKGALELFLKRWINPDLKLFGHLVWLRTALAVGYLQRAFNFNDLASYAELYHYVSTVLESCRTAAEKLVPGSPGLTPGSVHPAHVIKRKADVGGGDGNKSSSKVGRVEGSTDAASSRTLHQQDPEVSEHEASGQSAKAG